MRNGAADSVARVAALSAWSMAFVAGAVAMVACALTRDGLGVVAGLAMVGWAGWQTWRLI